MGLDRLINVVKGSKEGRLNFQVFVRYIKSKINVPIPWLPLLECMSPVLISFPSVSLVNKKAKYLE